MITSITLENFKGIRDKVCIELKPITLLFGANSAGKSTIVQAIRYAQEIFLQQKKDNDYTVLGGEEIELGGFNNLVYNHDLSRNIVLRYDLDISDFDFPEYEFYYLEEDFPQDSEFSEQKQLWSIKFCWIEIEIAWCSHKNQPFIKNSEFGFDGDTFARFSCLDADDGHAAVNTTHPILHYKEIPEIEIPEKERWVKFPLKKLNSAFPCSVRFDNSKYFEPPYNYSCRWCETVFNRATRGILGIFKDIFRQFRYIGPLRQIPKRNYQPLPSRYEMSWANGLAAWDSLYMDQSLRNEVSDWLKDHDKLDTGYRLKMLRYKELDLDSPLGLALMRGTVFDDIDNTSDELNKTLTYQRLYLVDELKGVNVLPEDIGVGISQILPIIVAAITKRWMETVAIEQPELHIHPAMQTKLGDLFIKKLRLKNFIIETHSEHLLLRVMRRIRETTHGNLPSPDLALKADNIVVYFIEIDGSQTIIREMPLNEEGELVKAWPGGFFEERFGELF